MTVAQRPPRPNFGFARRNGATLTAWRDDGADIAYRDGVALAVLEGDYLRPLAEVDPASAADLASALAGRRVPAITSGFIGR